MNFFKRKKKADAEPEKNLSRTEIKVVVRTADETVFDGAAISVSSLNDFGYFDVLPVHIDFITTIREKLTIQTIMGEIKEIPLDSGILRVYENNVDVFLGLKAVSLDLDLEEKLRADMEAKKKAEKEKKKSGLFKKKKD